jgi:hypothetical protein
MPEFLAETYAPRDAPDLLTPGAAAAALAADQITDQGTQVRLLHAIILPEDETCLYLFQAPSASAVRAAMTRARLRPDRITPAVPVRPPCARPDPAPGTGGTTQPAAPSPDPPGTCSGPRQAPGKAGPAPPPGARFHPS